MSESVHMDPFASVSGAPPNPYENLSPHARAAYAEQNAAIAAMRARQEASKGPTVFLPFGRQQPLRKYVGMDIIPFRKNPWIDKPELILKNPDPDAHYGFATYDARTKGMFRSHQYEPVYEDELIAENDVPYSVETVLAPIRDTLTEKGVANLVLWFGMVMIRIPKSVWMREYEMPALQSASRLTAHQESFNAGSMGSQQVVHDPDGTIRHQAGELSVNRTAVKTVMAIGPDAQDQVDRKIREL